VALHGEAEESLVHDVDVPSQRRFGDLIAASASGPRHERERQLASDRSPTPEPEHTRVDHDALHAQRMAAPPPEYRPADRDNSR
jgi:hypothetical protein